MMKTSNIDSEEIRRVKFSPLLAKQEYKLLSKEERQIVDELAVIIKRHKKTLGILKTAECLKHALDLM